MIDIENISLDEWYKCLKPYQVNIIKELVAIHGEERAAELWITSVGPVNTATFGGSPTGDQSKYWDKLKKEFDKFICGHSEYENEQKKFISTGKLIGTGAVSSIATWISPAVGMSPALLVPALLLLMHTAAKITVNAYCSTRHFNSNKSQGIEIDA